VGIAAQLPSGSSSTEDLDYGTFWDFLVKGGRAYESLENILPKHFFRSSPQVKLPAQGAFLKNPNGFDNISLGVSTRDARVIPYSARRLLDLAFQALLDSGIESRGRNIGCFMSGNRTLQGEASDSHYRRAIDADGSFSWAPHAMANRISYAFDLTGPSIHLDTACSSSLNALHLAIGAIERGDCVAALVGAAQINRDFSEWIAYAQGGVLALDGECRPFDAAAGGFGRGEGAIAIVLKPLKDAVRDHDHIYSVVLGSAINATGSRMPLNVPNGVSQQRCIREAYERSGLDPRDADYVELHATGTSVGDPIEVNASGQIFATDGPAVLGTVKGNIGHLEVAAFLASLVKACLIFEHGIIPPTVNFSNPAGTIDWEAFQIVVPIEPVPLGCRSPSGRSIISLSSSGLGGTTGHVVLQAPPLAAQTATEFSTAPILFLVGGLSSQAVDHISEGISELDVDDPKIIRDCAVTLSRRARQLPWRKYFTVPLSPLNISPAARIPNEIPPLAFVFSGQGPQHLKMGRQLFAEYPVFRNTVIELDDVYRRIRGVSLMETTGLFTLAGSLRSAPTVTLPDFGWPVTITVSAIAMVQIAMFDLLSSLDIVPDMMLGHSAGETAILYASGAGSKAMAMEVAIARGEAMACTESGEVGMAMLACSAQGASELISRVTANDIGIMELSCFNTPDSVAVSGTAALLDKLVAVAKDEEIFAQRIRTMVPGHSSFMDCIKGDYLARMDEIFARYPGSHAPRIPVYSTCRDKMFIEVFTAEYFWDNCRNAVLFSKAISDALASSSPVFLEISCHAVLSSSILAREVPDSRVLCPMRRISAKEGHFAALTEPEIFLDTLGRLSLLGVNSLDLSGLYGPSAYKSKLIEHPLAVRTIPPPKSLSPRLLQSVAPNWGPLSSSNLRISKSSHPDLAEHVINGEPILPATGFIELLLEAGANFLWDVEFVSILSLASAASLEIELQRLDSAWSITTVTASRSQEHARGFMDRSTSKNPPPVIDCESIDKDFYSSLEGLADYGPRFQRVVRCHGGPSEVIAEVKGPTSDELSGGYLLYPAIMDACLHVMLHSDISKQYSRDVMYLPSRLEHFIFYRRKYDTGNWFSHIRLRQWTPESRHYDVLITDSSGFALCEMRNLIVRKFTSVAAITVNRRFDLVFQPVAVNSAVPILPMTFPERADKQEIQLLYETLDSLAMGIISKSLARDLVIGEDVRQWLYWFIKILEVGAGTGLFTYPLLVADLARKIAYDSINPKAYDISGDPDAQGIPSESYDVVVALHVLHAAPHMKPCLASLRNLLVPGGCFLIVELDGAGWANKTGSVWLDTVDFINVQTCVESRDDSREFFFLAQKPCSYSTPTLDPDVHLGHVYSYEFGKETELQRQIGDLDTAASLTMYLLAIHGRDADAAIGFCAALRKDIPVWDIRLAVFESSMDFSNPIPLLTRHMGTFSRTENVISFDRDGGPRVPRVVLSPPPPSTQPDAVDDPSYVTVHISHWAGMSNLYDGFVGQVTEGRQRSMYEGQIVGGVAKKSSAKFVRVHIANIVSTAEHPDIDFAAQFLGTLLVSVVPWPSSGATARMAVAIDNDSLAQVVAQHARNLPRIQVVFVDFRNPNISERLDILISDSATYAQHPHLHRWIPRSGKIFLWDELLNNIIRDDPSRIRRTLAHISQAPSELPPRQIEHIPHAAAPSAAPDNSMQPSISRSSPPFRSDRAYVLLGGIGGLGIDLAVWLYQHGARHLVLTSRRGFDSLDPAKDALTLAKVGYLQDQDGLNLQLCKCNATDADQMKALLHGLPAPIAGCFLMTLVLSDAPFFNQTHDTFHGVYASKLRVFEVLSMLVEIKSLDFFVALSSISGLVGIPGQTNYASACTALDGVLARYPNAFSLITPGILDAGYLVRLIDDHRLNPSDTLWAYLEDGLRKLDDGPFAQYIPAVDWLLVDRQFTLPMSCRHLLSPNSRRPVDSTRHQHNREGVLTRTVLLDILGVSPEDFSPDIPLSSYGLDSLGASRLATALRPFMTVTQMQLMGQTTWTELLDLVQFTSESSPDPSAQPLVEICSGSGIPLIILPGGTGSIGLFFSLRSHFQGNLWAIQVTESTPLESFEALVEFWRAQIRAKRPHGPYRFAAYSGSTLFAVALTKMMEDAGQEVVQLTFIDHCPTLWTSEESEALLREWTVVEFQAFAEESLLDCLRYDSVTTGAEALSSYQAAIRGLVDAPPSTCSEVKILRAVMTLLFTFLQQFYPASRERSYDTFIGPFKTWLASVKAPLAVLVAEHGFMHTVPGREWPDLGASRLAEAVKVHYISGVGHFGLFRDVRLTQVLDV
ncbi:hypothetical protein FB451DRAFT_1042909, partial [Mycena latifolia]